MPSILSDELRGLLLPYSRAGVGEWRRAKDLLQRTVRNILGQKWIAEGVAEAENALARAGRGSPEKLIPMPLGPGRVRFARAFFSPLVTDGGGSTRLAFEVVVIVAKKQALAYRFEPPHRDGTHTYAHVQMSREVLGRILNVEGVPSWLPTSYPAHPLPSHDPLGLFLCMLTSMHGYRGGSQQIIRDVLLAESRSADVSRYIARLDALLLGQN